MHVGPGTTLDCVSHRRVSAFAPWLSVIAHNKNDTKPDQEPDGMRTTHYQLQQHHGKRLQRKRPHHSVFTVQAAAQPSNHAHTAKQLSQDSRGPGSPLLHSATSLDWRQRRLGYCGSATSQHGTTGTNALQPSAPNAPPGAQQASLDGKDCTPDSAGKDRQEAGVVAAQVRSALQICCVASQQTGMCTARPSRRTR